MLKGIDVSENNGYVDWNAVKAAGMDFAIIRLGFGNRHLDTNFYENVNEALAVGLKIGIYYYSYALDEPAARSEARYMLSVLQDAGLTKDKIEMGLWFDMEDADGYKSEMVCLRIKLSQICAVLLLLPAMKLDIAVVFMPI